MVRELSSDIGLSKNHGNSRFNLTTETPISKRPTFLLSERQAALADREMYFVGMIAMKWLCATVERVMVKYVLCGDGVADMSKHFSRNDLHSTIAVT